MAIKVSNSRKKAVFSEINITPLTDIFLVLLIIMMVVAPMFQSNVEGITVPEINSGLTVEEKAATVSITKEGQYYLNGEPIELDNLTQALTELKSELKKPEVLVKADTAAKSKDILQVMRAAKDAEYEKLTVAGEPLSRKEQKELKKKAEEDMRSDNQNIVPVTNKSEDSYSRPYAEKPAVQTSRQSDFANTDWEE
ncbi:MAG: ExbD/TolR family protein [Candidatus Gastranaerophilaceae bacterium]